MENPDDNTAQEMLDYYSNWKLQTLEKEQDPEWQKDNMEYDLRTSEYMLEKVRGDDVYAQHLYAAMCNNDFQKNDVWPILTGKTWSASWRYAGGIIADMQGTGDYIDWYCSGIRNPDDVTDEGFQILSEEQKQYYLESQRYVNEGVITDEIREDLFKLGWMPVEGNDDDF